MTNNIIEERRNSESIWEEYEMLHTCHITVTTTL